MDAPLDFWFEFGSTYSYPAAMRIARLAGKAGVRVRWRPFALTSTVHHSIKFVQVIPVNEIGQPPDRPANPLPG